MEGIAIGTAPKSPASLAALIESRPNPAGRRRPLPLLEDLGPEAAGAVRAYHRTWEAYRPTPLVALPALARYAGLGAIYVKDEAQRFGIGAFKVLGGTYALGRYLMTRWQLPPGTGFPDLQAAARRHPPLTVVAASDGNHGLGVAWAARALGQQAVIFLPAGTVTERVARIRALGARAEVSDRNYDDTVRLAAAWAAAHCDPLIQDTAWPGYTEIPLRVMQGYLTMALEADEQLAAAGEEPPTHVVLQAGVGSLAAAVTGYFAARYGSRAPRILIAEPAAAPALYRSAASPDGWPAAVGGPLTTIMAGLACGEPNPQAWPLLREWASAFLICGEAVAARGTRILAGPLPGDPALRAGESGSMPLGLLVTLCDQPAYTGLAHALGLGPEARVLLFNTEGITDPDLHRAIVWDGAFPLPAG
ncbi:MAG: diaminopropionate ammonia-lyase [Firmicutes bacterium]|nr:diaminopropionate ammonia-lyase [Bacillota bacterium]